MYYVIYIFMFRILNFSPRYQPSFISMFFPLKFCSLCMSFNQLVNIKKKLCHQPFHLSRYFFSRVTSQPSALSVYRAPQLYVCMYVCSLATSCVSNRNHFSVFHRDFHCTILDVSPLGDSISHFLFTHSHLYNIIMIFFLYIFPPFQFITSTRIETEYMFVLSCSNLISVVRNLTFLSFTL